MLKRKWQVENIIPHKVWPFQIQCHAFCSYECPRNFQHMMNDIFKEFLNDFVVFTGHLDIFQEHIKTFETCTSYHQQASRERVVCKIGKIFFINQN